MVLAIFLCVAGIVIGVSSSSIFFFSNVAEARMETWIHMIIPSAGLIGSLILAGYLILRLVGKQAATEQEKREMKKDLNSLEKTLNGDQPEKEKWLNRFFPKNEEKQIPFLQREPPLLIEQEKKGEKS
jgi:hypothetical protein